MGLKEDMDKVKKFVEEEERIRDEKAKKKWKYPFGKKVGKSQKKKNFITLLKINENGSAEFKKVKIEDQVFFEEGIPRLAAAGYVLNERKNPLVILPSWSVELFSPIKHFQESLIDGTNSKGYKLLMANMEKEAIKQKTQVSGIIKWIIGFGLLAIIVYALVTGGV